jgi:hypothetical protein
MGNFNMAISDYKTYLYVEGATAGKYHKLVDITSAPATGAAPKSLDTTTLSDSATTGIPDRPETPSMEFEYLYTKENFTAVSEAISSTEDKNFLIIYQDNTGYKFPARGTTWTKEVSVGSVVKAGIGLIASAPPEHVDDTSTLVETAPAG